MIQLVLGNPDFYRGFSAVFSVFYYPGTPPSAVVYSDVASESSIILVHRPGLFVSQIATEVLYNQVSTGIISIFTVRISVDSAGFSLRFLWGNYCFVLYSFQGLATSQAYIAPPSSSYPLLTAGLTLFTRNTASTSILSRA